MFRLFTGTRIRIANKREASCFYNPVRRVDLRELSVVMVSNRYKKKAARERQLCSFLFMMIKLLSELQQDIHQRKPRMRYIHQH